MGAGTGGTWRRRAPAGGTPCQFSTELERAPRASGHCSGTHGSRFGFRGVEDHHLPTGLFPRNRPATMIRPTGFMKAPSELMTYPHSHTVLAITPLREKIAAGKALSRGELAGQPRSARRVRRRRYSPQKYDGVPVCVILMSEEALRGSAVLRRCPHPMTTRRIRSHESHYCTLLRLALGGMLLAGAFGFNESKLSAKDKKGIDVWVLSSSSDAQDASTKEEYQRLVTFAQYDDDLRKSLNGANTCKLKMKAPLK